MGLSIEEQRRRIRSNRPTPRPAAKSTSGACKPKKYNPLQYTKDGRRKKPNKKQLNRLQKKVRLKYHDKIKSLDVMSERLCREPGMTYAKYLQTSYWKQVRDMVMQRDKKSCTVCRSKSKLQVHHTSYTYLKSEHRHLQDLITLCGTCHEEYHKTVPDHLQPSNKKAPTEVGA